MRPREEIKIGGATEAEGEADQQPRPARLGLAVADGRSIAGFARGLWHELHRVRCRDTEQREAVAYHLLHGLEEIESRIAQHRRFHQEMMRDVITVEFVGELAEIVRDDVTASLEGPARCLRARGGDVVCRARRHTPKTKPTTNTARNKHTHVRIE